jgi:hypothetical protein
LAAQAPVAANVIWHLPPPGFEIPWLCVLSSIEMVLSQALTTIETIALDFRKSLIDKHLARGPEMAPPEGKQHEKVIV